MNRRRHSLLKTVVATAFAVLLSLGPAGCNRSKHDAEDRYYGVEWISGYVPPVLEADMLYRLPFRIKNTGTGYWMQDATIRIMCHIYDATGVRLVDYNGIAESLMESAAPGETITTWCKISTPKKPGTYLIAFDLTHTSVTMFAKHGSKPPVYRVKVIPRTRPREPARDMNDLFREPDADS